MGKKDLYDQLEFFFESPGGPVIFDGNHCFPTSSVKFTKFKSFELRQMFACLRQKENILQREISKSGEKEENLRIRINDAIRNSDEARAVWSMLRLMAVEEALCWMVANVTGTEEDRIY